MRKQTLKIQTFMLNRILLLVHSLITHPSDHINYVSSREEIEKLIAENLDRRDEAKSATQLLAAIEELHLAIKLIDASKQANIPPEMSGQISSPSGAGFTPQPEEPAKTVQDTVAPSVEGPTAVVSKIPGGVEVDPASIPKAPEVSDSNVEQNCEHFTETSTVQKVDEPQPVEAGASEQTGIHG